MIGDRLERYFEAVYPRTDAQRKKGERPPRWAYLYKKFESRPDLQMPGVGGTMWAAYSAIAAYEDYKQPQQEELPDQRLERTWFGSGGDTKLSALDKAVELAKEWKE